MDKNLILAFLLAFLVLVGYNMFITKFVKTPTQPITQDRTFNDQHNKTIEKDKIEKLTPTIPSQPSEIKQTYFEEKEVIVDTPLFTGTISNNGGGIKSWKLKSYKESLEKDSPPINMLSAEGLDRYPLDISIIDPSSGIEKRVELSPLTESINIEKGSQRNLILTGSSPEGIEIKEELVFSGDSYAVDIEVEITNGSSQSFNGRLSMNLFGLTESAKATSRYAHIGPISLINGEVKRESVKDVKKGKDYRGDILWTGIEDKYFLASLLPETSGETELKIGNFADGKAIVSRLIFREKFLSPHESHIYRFKAYIGPKEIGLLKDIGKRLDEAINFGYFTFIAKPLHFLLKFFYSFLFNYGLAIILLTVLIKIAFYPLTKQSLTSMKEMQKIQPQLAAIKKKYANDKEGMNKELMELYKRNKVNPLGGCLPMILQIPVFIALYNILLSSIEIRHAPFILWIQDLSAKDPYYISPLLMGASMLVQQKMSPSSVDPQQAKMMMLMPVFFTFLFLNFPSGLVLYWLVNNLLQIGQQYKIQKKS